MKILYSHYLTDESHPAVQMVYQISRHLREIGNKVFVHASAGLEPARARIDNGKARPAKPIVLRLKNSFWFAKAIARNRNRIQRDREAIKKFQPDVIIARQDAYSWSMVKAAIEHKLPCITYADAPVAYECRWFESSDRWHPPALVEQIEKWVLKHSQAVITVSHPAKRRLQHYQLATPIDVNPNGVDAEKFKVIDADIQQAKRAELGLQSELVVGFQGTFKAFHGLDRLRDLILWSKRVANLKWLLIGDGPERLQLESSVRNCDNVIFLGKRHPDEMSQWLSIMDIAVAPHSQLPGDFYFCPLKILEYAASGCATIASDQGDIPSLLNCGKGGVIVKDDKLESWTIALQSLIEDESRRISIAENSREFVLTNLTWRHTAERVDEVLRRVVARSNTD